MTCSPETANDVREVLTRWMLADDAGRDDEWVDRYITDDFLFTVGDRRFSGRGEIRSLNAARVEGPPRGIHVLSEPAITANGEEVHVASAFLYITGIAGAYAVTIAGVYEDDFVRSEGTWQCRRRHTTHLPTTAGETSA
jgi:hypothetical protein